MSILRQFFVPFTGWLWLCKLGLALLPVTLVLGLFSPRVAFGVAVWDYVILLAIPFMFAPKVLRSMICNRRLVLVPGLATRVMLAAFLFTLVVSGFIPAFAALYHVKHVGPASALQLLIVNSAYLVFMQYAMTTAWAMVALSLLPVTCIGVFLYIMQGVNQQLVNSGYLVMLLALVVLGWLVAGFRSSTRHHFKPEHASVEHYQANGYRRTQLAHWLFQGSNAVGVPDASLLLGYPATLPTRLRVLVYSVFLGPTVGAVFLTLIGFGAEWSWHPSPLEIFICASLFPAAFAAFQNLEWVSRLRLVWLRRPRLRNELWQFLELQLAINLGLLMLACGVLTVAGLLFSQLPASLLLHYPVLILVFNVFYSYYVICARTSAWQPYWGMLISIVGSLCIFAGLWVALIRHDTTLFYALEALVIVGAFRFRALARVKLHNVDWLVARPLHTKNTI